VRRLRRCLEDHVRRDGARKFRTSHTGDGELFSDVDCSKGVDMVRQSVSY